MLGFITNDNNDFMLDDYGNIAMSDGIQAYEQHIKNELKLQQYEYSYKLTDGINYLGYVLGKAPNLQAWETQVLDLVKSMSFVEKIVDWGYDINGNNFQFSLTVSTDLGEITVKG